MRRGNSTIELEDKYEIDEIISALEIYLQEHPNAREKDTVKKMINLLDRMCMEW